MKSINILFLTGLLGLCLACDKLTEVDFPKNQLTGNTVFQDQATTESAMANLYAKIRERGTLAGTRFGIPFLMGNYADELTYYGITTNDFFHFYNHSVTPANETVFSIWKDTYNQIYEANRIIEAMTNNEQLSIEFQNQIQGEALFLRAYLHVNLCNLFGKIPYITSTDYQLNTNPSRQEVELVYTQAIADLELALSIIGDSERAPQRIYAGKMAVKALLARMHAYQENWEEVIDYTTTIISSSEYVLNPDLTTAFLKNNPSTIWQLHPGAANRNTYEAETHYIATTPPTNAALSSDLINSFEANDLRKSVWTTAISDTNGNEWYYASKYKQRDGTSANEFAMQLKLEEVYLLHAEASAHIGDVNEAQNSINNIRNRASLPNTTANTLASLLLAIENERRWELFCEGAHRWFDLKRWNRLQEVIAPVKPNWIDTNQLLPIPERELLSNQNLLPQNPGY